MDTPSDLVGNSAPSSPQPPAPPSPTVNKPDQGAPLAPTKEPSPLNSPVETVRTPEPAKTHAAIKLVAIGNAGINILEELIRGGVPGLETVAINTDSASLAASSAAQKECLETRPWRSLGAGADAERAGELAEENSARFKSLFTGTDLVLLLAGLGGVAGSNLSPLLARTARESGALILGFVTLPFDCECNRRQALARHALGQLREITDGVVCLPNQKVLKLVDQTTSLLDTFRRADALLADAVRGVWRLLTRRGLLELRFSDLAALLRDAHAESSFAVAEATGATRGREVLDRLLAHPMLEEGQALAQADAVLVSLMGGPDLTMSEVNLLMGELQRQCGQAQVLLGAVIDETFRDRLAVTLIVARKEPDPELDPGSPVPAPEGFERQLLSKSPEPRPASRFTAPPPSLAPDKLDQLMVRQAAGIPRPRKHATKLRQTQLPLEILSKGRFDKSEPTIHKGEDLDVPTYIRRGISLN